MSRRPFRIIAAAVGGQKGGIGFRNKLPWNIPQELQHFRAQTDGCAVIMGRNTWNSLPKRPLPNRLNVVVTNTIDEAEQFITASTLDSALAKIRGHRRIYVIGGEEIYRKAIVHDDCEAVELTNISREVLMRQSMDARILSGNTDTPVPLQFDRFFPNIPQSFELISNIPMTGGIGNYEVWEKTMDNTSPEWSFLNLLRNVRYNGELVITDRTGVGTLQLFGVTVRFRLDNDRIPVLTSKRVHWKSVSEEILQFARGDIDARKLNIKGVKIWNGHTSRKHLDTLDGGGGNRIEEGSMWKAYGWQWRQWGMPYLGIDIDYMHLRKMMSNPMSRQRLNSYYPALKDVTFHDQLATVVHQLKTNPSSRRIVLSAWNVGDLDQMCLPPCHMLYTFNVSRGQLNCQLTQRSWDLFLGAPFNIAGTALLVRLLCATTGLEPGEIKIDAANAHIYLNHLNQVDDLLERAENLGLYRFPTLEIKKKLESLDDWESLTANDLVLHGYRCHPPIKAHMAI